MNPLKQNLINKLFLPAGKEHYGEIKGAKLLH